MLITFVLEKSQFPTVAFEERFKVHLSQYLGKYFCAKKDYFSLKTLFKHTHLTVFLGKSDEKGLTNIAPAAKGLFWVG